MDNNKEKNTVSDQQEAQVVKQAIKDDQALAAVASDIEVTVKDGTIILDGEVSTEQQSKLATNTAAALGVDQKVKNHIEVTHNK